jgi:hypothetical protein
MEFALSMVVALALAVVATGVAVWWLGRSYVGRRVWVGVVVAVAGALAVVTLAHGLLAP